MSRAGFSFGVLTHSTNEKKENSMPIIKREGPAFIREKTVEVTTKEIRQGMSRFGEMYVRCYGRTDDVVRLGFSASPLGHPPVVYGLAPKSLRSLAETFNGLADVIEGNDNGDF
jgi:hypothetical protein